VRLDDNETRNSGARRADVTGVGAWVHVEDLALPKSLKSCNFTLVKLSSGGCRLKRMLEDLPM
jgi:hypothetical protein